MSLYGAPVIGTKNFSLFGIAQFSLWARGTVNYVTNSLLIGSRCIPNGTHMHTLSIVEPIMPTHFKPYQKLC